ncbi:MAG TPA: peptidylprolyl isomerase, partial [Dongiaceae bacterium]|nr:peptidylprolyl isomerase [Dongiaceae bacterium]
ELLAQWRRLDPWSRPRVETTEAIEELVNNGLFERLLRQQASERRLDQRPDIAALLARRHEYIAVSQLVSREVYAKIRPDSAALTRWYGTHRARYRTPDRATIGRWLLPDRASAGRFAATLLDNVKAESLMAQGRRGGANFLDVITAQDDSVLLKEAIRLGPGALIGPDSTGGAWRVVKVISLELARPMSYAEARPMVVSDLTDSLGEVGLRSLIARVRRETPVRIHPHAVELMMAAH